MKSSTLLAKIVELGIASSRGRLRVRNDNPYSESLLRTLTYCPQWSTNGFATLQAVRDWVDLFWVDLFWVGLFIEWYNNEHRHSGICLVTTRHLAARHAVYEMAQATLPERWPGAIRNWQPIGDGMLKPEKNHRCQRTAIEMADPTTTLTNAG
jgi:putative transposase